MSQKHEEYEVERTDRIVLIQRRPEWLLLVVGAALFVLGYVAGQSNVPHLAAPAAVASAEPVALAPAQPQPEVLPDVPVTRTLEGAREALRLGRADAPVSVVVFSDPQCPFCRQLALGAEQQFIREYVDTGKANLVYRHYAFLGPESTRGAEALECAGHQGKFWELHRLVYENQFPENSGQVTDAKLSEWAASAGLNVADFASCLNSGHGKAAVDADYQVGVALDVRGTPATFVNGKRVVGAVPYEMLKATVDAAMNP